MSLSWIRLSQAGLREGRYLIDIETHEGRDQIYFSVPSDFFAHNDSVAAALATLCGKKYDSIRFSFSVSPQCCKAISERTGANVSALVSGTCRSPGKNIALNFSGGFDSLASHILAPEQIRIAVDFGSWFDRERKFFETLDPEIICRTDFRQKGYADNRDQRQPPVVTKSVENHDWLFMYAVSLLFADYLDLGRVGLGTIFEASTYNYYVTSNLATSGWHWRNFFEAVGLSETTLTRGLTEFGTARLILHYMPEVIDNSILSVAPPNSEKGLRKRLLIDVSRHRSGAAAPHFERYDYPKEKLNYGESYPIDFLAALFVRLYGPEVVSRWINRLDRLDVEALNRIDTEWIFRYNPFFIYDIPNDLRQGVMDRMRVAGIEPFRDADWQHYRAFREILAEFHRFPFDPGGNSTKAVSRAFESDD